MASRKQREVLAKKNVEASVLYRILTERKNVDQVKSLLGAYGLDYTLFYGDGAWQCVPEDSMAIELANLPRALAESVSRAIKRLNGQEAILLQEIPLRNIFL